jgi:hypothetical protein
MMAPTIVVIVGGLPISAPTWAWRDGIGFALRRW